MRLKRLFYDYWYVLISVIVALVLFCIPEQKASKHDITYCTNHEYKEKINVYVKGASVITGKVCMYEGSTIADLLSACRVNDKSNTSGLKLDEILVDGATYTINSDSLDVITIKNHTTQVKDIEYVTKVKDNVSDLVNINTSSKDILMTLPGIGNVKAGNIISYREKTKFTKTSELVKVDGISDEIYNEIKDYITC